MPTSNQTRANTGTDKLASFAWTGVILPSPESSTEESHTEFINSPPQVGHPVEERMSHIELKRGWTLAMAMADDGVTDEVLVEELEKMRRKSGPEQQYRLSRTWMRQSPPKPGHTRSATTTNASEGTVHLQLHDLNRATSIDVSDAEEAATWHIARRALLCCREIVRTEKRYQEELKALLDGDVRTASMNPNHGTDYFPDIDSSAGCYADIFTCANTSIRKSTERPVSRSICLGCLDCFHDVRGRIRIGNGSLEWRGRAILRKETQELAQELSSEPIDQLESSCAAFAFISLDIESPQQLYCLLSCVREIR